MLANNSYMVSQEWVKVILCDDIIRVASGVYTDLFLTWSDDINDKIQHNNVLITDISQSRSPICWYQHEENVHLGGLKWYHRKKISDDDTQIPMITQDTDYLGWNSEIVPNSNSRFSMLRLIKRMETAAIEGKFTCRIKVL